MDKYDGLFTLDKFKNPINNGRDDISDIYGEGRIRREQLSIVYFTVDENF